MALAWGVKEEVEPQYASAVSEHIEKIQGTEIELESGEKAKILKGGVKERNGQATLIYRYQLV
ncbi:hypothetical protein CLPU_15c00340 [Gottschalkia purinilytica]|uniref:Uncharacterized protein n=1 Tax=Gottschalkia purinilytica TaxID=1503 RepID=A0A0L0W8E6_GOTPU|nr:hypothetical protein [Gottschalkia purinilytica]KNF07540.1 hypothetical protein CLPU_15c00340 [Gottschalkia purinilytica]